MKNKIFLTGLVLLFAFFSAYNSMAQLTPQEAVKLMGRGINLGNTLEPPHEGDWTGNQPAKEYYFEMYKDAGFKTVRIPVRYDEHASKTSPYTIDIDWMDRVEQVVDWGLDRDLFVIINLHHEESLKNDYANQHVRYDSIWSQISKRFIGKTQKLLFEIVNEPNGLTQAEIDEFNATVLGIIRKDHPTRIVIYSGNGWASSNDLKNAAIPDPDDAYLMGYYHSYDPWSFAGESQGTWGTTTDKNNMINQMAGVQEWSETNNIPVLIGEFGAMFDCDYNSRMLYYATYVEQALAHKMAFCVWDDDGWFQVLQRNDSSWNELKDILIYTSDTSPTALKTKLVDNSKIELSWKSRSNSKRRIYVERRTLTTQFVEVAEVGSVSTTTDNTTYVDTDIEDGKTYFYKVVEEYNNITIPSYPISMKVKLVSINDQAKANMKVYPNPATNQINVITDDGQIHVINLYNSSGQLILTKNIGESSTVINVDMFKTGLYFIIAKTDSGLMKSTFVIN